ncbi:MAG: divergent polysaccharide deacetylase family protein [Acidobacteria bacterium]|nr:divergent polysaccharide deacetylase family protein [Acidobacteriota bacterium]
MTPRTGRAKKKSGGGFRTAALLVFAVALGAGVTWALRGCRAPERSAPAPARAPAAAAPAPAAPRKVPAVRMPADFESVDGRAGAGVVAVLLDDLGYDPHALDALAGWNAPLAVAVIPSAPHAARAVALAKEKGWDLLVHLPMEPEAGPSEAEAIGSRDADDVIRAKVLQALARTPGALGVNNHQGSKATADARVVRAVLAVVKEKGLFFLDSRTTGASVVGAEAAAMRVPFLARDVFLDDVAAETSAKGGAPEARDAAWARALQIAAKKGEAIVIGHPHKETLAFLEKRLASEKSSGARLVKVSELVP